MHSAEEVDFEIMEAHRRRVEEIVADPAMARGPQAVLPLHLQAPLLPRRVPAGLQQPQRHAGRLPGRHREDHRQGPRGRREAVRGRLHHLRDGLRGRAHAPCSAASATRSSAATGSRWPSSGPTGPLTLFGILSRGFPNMFVMPAPSQQSVVTVNYTQLAVLGAEFVGTTIGLLQRAGSRGVRRERRGRASLGAGDRRHVHRHHPGHVRLHAVAHQQRGASRDAEPASPATTAAASATGSPTASSSNSGSADGRFEGLELDVPLAPRHEPTPAGGRRHRRRGRDRRRPSPRRWAAAAGTSSPSTRWSPSTAPSSLPEPEDSTAARIVAAGGSARASSASVTDADGRLRALFDELVDAARRPRCGGERRRHHPAELLRPGTEEDWLALLDVHLGGYLNVLDAALPLMAEAGHGRILGVTSGFGMAGRRRGRVQRRQAGRRGADLAARTGRPPGVTVNALSPIANTRMVAAALERARAEGRAGGRRRAVARRHPGPREPRPARRVPGRRRARLVQRPGLLRRRPRGGRRRPAAPASRSSAPTAWSPWPASSRPSFPAPSSPPRPTRRPTAGPIPGFGSIFDDPAPAGAASRATCGPAPSSASAPT